MNATDSPHAHGHMHMGATAPPAWVSDPHSFFGSVLPWEDPALLVHAALGVLVVVVCGLAASLALSPRRVPTPILILLPLVTLLSLVSLSARTSDRYSSVLAHSPASWLLIFLVFVWSASARVVARRGGKAEVTSDDDHRYVQLMESHPSTPTSETDHDHDTDDDTMSLSDTTHTASGTLHSPSILTPRRPLTKMDRVLHYTSLALLTYPIAVSTLGAIALRRWCFWDDGNYFPQCVAHFTKGGVLVSLAAWELSRRILSLFSSAPSHIAHSSAQLTPSASIRREQIVETVLLTAMGVIELVTEWRPQLDEMQQQHMSSALLTLTSSLPSVLVLLLPSLFSSHRSRSSNPPHIPNPFPALSIALIGMHMTMHDAQILSSGASLHVWFGQALVAAGVGRAVWVIAGGGGGMSDGRKGTEGPQGQRSLLALDVLALWALTTGGVFLAGAHDQAVELIHFSTLDASSYLAFLVSLSSVFVAWVVALCVVYLWGWTDRAGSVPEKV
ncbi:hypothetical protein M427DRAFT_32224 [Gonapodya prolifera JEL478]|uniref:Protein YTP1-like C-terminal domain-containing protein n=1 Tax=Gonapodya prolifera (strain JEL478) TaxID=1344416 RepID=A0A139AFE4_GONPJ|nr:hypothetical protein M427DRAFT_32224 [Gonapodya prolifera JEL478]|eukprot:KXS15531.1 hypothetical protein M427DRAFT_32224 [Gonapodya prolifera JEL478]